MMDGAEDRRTKECSCPSRLQYQDVIGEYRIEKRDSAHAFREPTRGNRLISISCKCFLRRTKLQFFCDEWYTRCYGLLTDLVGRAICGSYPAVGFLK